MSPRERIPIRLNTADPGFFGLVWSDYIAAYHFSGKLESTAKAALLFLPRMLLVPGLQLALSVRIGQKGPGFLIPFIRWLQVFMFSSEIWWFRGETAIVIGPGVVFPHPINILIGPGTIIGEGVAIYNNTQIGADRSFEAGEGEGAVAERAVQIGDRAIVFAYAVLQGPFNVGERGVVGLRVFLDEDVPPGAFKTPKGLRLEGEWPGIRGTMPPEPS